MLAYWATRTPRNWICVYFQSHFNNLFIHIYELAQVPKGGKWMKIHIISKYSCHGCVCGVDICPLYSVSVQKSEPLWTVLTNRYEKYLIYMLVFSIIMQTWYNHVRWEIFKDCTLCVLLWVIVAILLGYSELLIKSTVLLFGWIW